MIDTKELRLIVQDYRLAGSPVFIQAADMDELLDRLEAAESECLEQARLNGMGSSREAALLAKLEAAEKERDFAKTEIARLHDDIRELTDVRVLDEKLGSELNAVAKERDALHAKIAEMEKQEPVAFGLYSGWALKATYLKEHEACEQRDRRQLTADLGGSLEAYRVSPLYALPGAQNIPEKLCYDSRWEISIDYVDGWNAAVDMMRGKSPSWHCPDCCIAFPFGAPKSCPNDDARCNSLLAAAPEIKP